MWKRGKEQFLLFSTIFQYISNFRKQIAYLFVTWLFDLFFTQFCKSDMSRYGYLEVLQSPLDFEITRVDSMLLMLRFGWLIYFACWWLLFFFFFFFFFFCFCFTYIRGCGSQPILKKAYNYFQPKPVAFYASARFFFQTCVRFKICQSNHLLVYLSHLQPLESLLQFFLHVYGALGTNTYFISLM